jgi:hypothetical protein
LVGCGQTLAAMVGIVLLALVAGLGMLLRPAGPLALLDRYLAGVERRMAGPAGRERIERLRERAARRTRDVRLLGLFYLLLGLPVLYALVIVGERLRQGTLPGC